MLYHFQFGIFSFSQLKDVRESRSREASCGIVEYHEIREAVFAEIIRIPKQSIADRAHSSKVGGVQGSPPPSPGLEIDVSKSARVGVFGVGYRFDFGRSLQPLAEVCYAPCALSLLCWSLAVRVVKLRSTRLMRLACGWTVKRSRQSPLAMGTALRCKSATWNRK